jgi:hypothetical protein
MIKLRVVLVGFCLGVVLGVACGGGGSKPPATGAVCLMNSQCNNPLSCTFGRCHAACMETRDCPTGQRCVIGELMVHVCQLPEQKTCKYNTDCIRPLVCARDLQCRNQCVGDRDCARNQRCLMPDNVCADMDEIDPSNNMLKNTIDGAVPPPPDGGGGSGDGSSGGDAGGGSDGGVVPDAASNTDMMVPDVVITVDSVTAVPTSAPQGGSAVITVTGPDVSNPANFSLGDVRVSLQPGATATMFKLNVTVPHGVALGPKTLTFTTSAGRGSKENAFTVTAITAGPMGNDTSGNGSADTPFRTFKRALQVATAGDSVRLLDGEYRLADGETWMVPIPDKVTVEGQSAAGTKLIGPGETGGSVSVDGLTFAGEGTVKNLTVTAFRANISIEKAGNVVALENVKAVGARSYALQISYQAMGAKVTLSGMDNDFTGSQSTAMLLQGPMATLTGTGAGRIGPLANGYALQVTGVMSTVSLNGYTLLAAPGGYSSVYCSAADATFRFEKTRFEDQMQIHGAMNNLDLVDVTMVVPKTVNYTVDFRGVKLNITGSTLEGSNYGVYQYNNMSDAKIRGSTFKDYTYSGYYMQAGKLDMGTMTEAGNNTFTGPETGWGLDDHRQSATTPITCSNTTFNAFRPPAGEKRNPGPYQLTEPGKYRIQTVGNAIVFYEL